MFEEAEVFAGMKSMRGLSQAEIAKSFGVSQSYVANKLRLLNFSKAIKEKILETKLSERHARALLKLKDEEGQSAAIDKICAMHLSVAASEALIDELSLRKKATRTEYDARASMRCFDEVLTDAITLLRQSGITVSKEESSYKNKRYITISIKD